MIKTRKLALNWKDYCLKLSTHLRMKSKQKTETDVKSSFILSKSCLNDIVKKHALIKSMLKILGVTAAYWCMHENEKPGLLI